VLVLDNLSKRYGVTQAVKSVSLTAQPGSVLGLVGENGAGKSSLIKMIAGVEQPTAGHVALEGEKLTLRDTNDALRHGVASVFQELTLLRSLTVQDNLLLTDGPRHAWRSLNRREGRKAAAELLDRYQLTMSPETPVRALPLGAQQMLEVVRAVERRPKVLLLDEATSALGAHEVEWLVRLVERLRGEGVIVLFISHRWDEIVRFSTHVAIMRNGELVGETDTGRLSEAEAIRLMTGQNFEASFPPRPAIGSEIVLRAYNLRSTVLRGVNLDLHRGEVLGLGGLVGQGQGALLEALFGAHELQEGTIEMAGRALRVAHPGAAIRAGLAYVPQERKTEGLLLDKSIKVNMTLSILRRISGVAGLINRGREQTLVAGAIERFHIEARSTQDRVQTLSGGNQQKVLLEKWLLTGPMVLLLNDVTRGVDIGTKVQIYAAIAACAARGAAVILYSTDALELVGLAHRVLVFKEGQVNQSLVGDAITSEEIVRASLVRGGADARHVA
jgi:ribose transport system ATP-binding protein